MPDANKLLVNTFLVDSLPFAAWLYAAGLLQLLGEELIDPDGGTVGFRFADPERKGQMLEQQYASGNAPVQAPAFHNALRKLRRKIEMAKAGNSRKVSAAAPADESRSRVNTSSYRQPIYRGNEHVLGSNSNFNR
jgi:hypothetical protein